MQMYNGIITLIALCTTGRMVVGSIGLWFGSFVGWIIGRLGSWSVCWFVGLLFDWIVSWLVGWMVG